jgi:gliding motility-associated-like protein
MKLTRFVLCILLVINVKSSIAGNDKKVLGFDFNKLDCPQINDNNIAIFPATCNTSDGKITGITATGTGTIRFLWYNSENDLVGTAADLIGVPSGIYTLAVSDQSKCTAVKKSYIIGIKNAVVFDDSNISIKPSSCNKNDGAVTGINVVNAVKYQWFNAANVVIAITPDLENVASGDYTLTATNAAGCSASNTYAVPSSALFPAITHIDTAIGSCGGIAGKLTLTFNSEPTDPIYSYAFINSTGGVVSSGDILYTPDGPTKITLELGTPNVNYSLVVTDPKLCKILVGNYSLPVPVFAIVTKGVVIRSDACGRHTGGVQGLDITGATAPVKYYGNPPDQVWTWTDSLGNVISHIPNLLLVGKGTYKLTVVDIMGCSDSKTFYVPDSTAEALPPSLNNITLCLPGTATLSVINPGAKLTYRLYDSTKTTVITENSYGQFQRTVTQTTHYYVTTVDGLCESTQTPVTITVVAPGVIIPNTFTPNNDGINDYWDIPHIDEFPGAEVSVFNRDGQRVYHSINYSKPFNGKWNGAELPTGTYYYVVDLKKPECLGKISASLTIIR